MDQPDETSLMTSLIRREKIGAVRYRPGNDEAFIREVRCQSVRAFHFFLQYTENLEKYKALNAMSVDAGALFSAAHVDAMDIEGAHRLNTRLAIFVERISIWYFHIHLRRPTQPALTSSQITTDSSTALANSSTAANNAVISQGQALPTTEAPTNSSTSANNAVISQGHGASLISEADRRREALMIEDLSNTRRDDIFLGSEDPVIQVENLDYLRKCNTEGTAAQQQYILHKKSTDAWRNLKAEGSEEDCRMFSGQSHRKTLMTQQNVISQTSSPSIPTRRGVSTLAIQTASTSRTGPISGSRQMPSRTAVIRGPTTLAIQTGSTSRTGPISGSRQMLSRTAVIRGPTTSFENVMRMRITHLDSRISRLQPGKMRVPIGSAWNMPDPAPAVGRLNMDILQVIVPHVEFKERLTLLRSCKALASLSGPCVAIIDVAKIASGAHSTPMVLCSERVQGKDGMPMDSFRYVPYSEAYHATTLVISDNLTNYWYKRVNEEYKFTEDTFVKVWRAALLCKGISQLEVHNTAYLWPGLITSTLLQDFKMLKVLRIRQCPFFNLKDLQIATDFPKSILNMNQEDLPFTVDFDFVRPTIHEDFTNTGYRTTDTSYFQVFVPHLLRSHEHRVIGNGPVRDMLCRLTYCPRPEAETILKLFHETSWEGTALFKSQEKAAVDRSRKWANKALSHTSPGLSKDVFDAIQFGVTKHKAQIRRMEIFEQRLSLCEANVAKLERTSPQELSTPTVEVAMQTSTTMKSFLGDPKFATNFDNSWLNAVREASHKTAGCDETTIDLRKFSIHQIKELLFLNDSGQVYQAQVDPMIDLIVACNAHLRPDLQLRWENRFNTEQPRHMPIAFQMELCSGSCEIEHYGNSFADSNIKSARRGQGRSTCGLCRQFDMLDELGDRENAYKKIRTAVSKTNAFIMEGLKITREKLPNNGMMSEKDRATLKSIQPSPSENTGHSFHYSTMYEDSDDSDTEYTSAPIRVAERPRYNREAFLSVALIISKIAGKDKK